MNERMAALCGELFGAQIEESRPGCVLVVTGLDGWFRTEAGAGRDWFLDLEDLSAGEAPGDAAVKASGIYKGVRIADTCRPESLHRKRGAADAFDDAVCERFLALEGRRG